MSLQRRPLLRLPDGRIVLQNTRSSRVDFYAPPEHAGLATAVLEEARCVCYLLCGPRAATVAPLAFASLLMVSGCEFGTITVYDMPPRPTQTVVLTIVAEDNVAIGTPDPIAAIHIRMEQKNLRQRDLEPMIGSRARVSEILSRKRSLTLPIGKQRPVQR